MSLSARRIGLIEDDPVMGESLMQRLALEGSKAIWWRGGREAVAAMSRSAPEAVVCDIRLPDLDGEAVFREACRAADPPPFLFITGYGDIDQAVRLMHAGAAYYITKPFLVEDLLVRLSELIGPGPGETLEPVLGVSPPMRDLERLLRRIAKVGSTVLIGGETGTGKEVAARFVHAMSAAVGQPFVAVNCAAIPADLLESELFGHEKGAFTGAGDRHLGYAERAGQGTLFLDEITELRADLQAKLLRVIEERTFHRVGGEKLLPFQARIVAASNTDLQQRVAQGRFREDLYYRINVVSVTLPPLRERPEDVIWLMTRFFNDFSAKMDTDLRGFSAYAEEAALAHSWAGNVRELRNRTERAVALGLGSWIMPGDLFPERDASGPVATQLESLEQTRLEAERRHILRALELTSGEVSAAARALGIGRTTLWEKMRRLGLGAAHDVAPPRHD